MSPQEAAKERIIARRAELLALAERTLRPSGGYNQMGGTVHISADQVVETAKTYEEYLNA